MRRHFWLFILVLSFSVGKAHAVSYPDLTGYLLPLTCAELLPDTAPFIGFFESVAKSAATKDRSYSRRLFRVLALRERLGRDSDRNRESNPIDVLIRKTLCFFREQKEPVRPVPYDDDKFNKFLKDGLKELEVRIDDTIFQYQFERQQRQEFERQLARGEGMVKNVRREADEDADRSFTRISQAARRKAMTQ